MLPKSLGKHDELIKCLLYIEDDLLLASGAVDKTIKIWDLQKATCISILKGHDSEINCLCYIKKFEKISLIASGSID